MGGLFAGLKHNIVMVTRGEVGTSMIGNGGGSTDTLYSRKSTKVNVCRCRKMYLMQKGALIYDIIKLLLLMPSCKSIRRLRWHHNHPESPVTPKFTQTSKLF